MFAVIVHDALHCARIGELCCLLFLATISLSLRNCIKLLTGTRLTTFENFAVASAASVSGAVIAAAATSIRATFKTHIVWIVRIKMVCVINDR